MKKLLFVCFAAIATMNLYAQSTAQQKVLQEIYGDLDKDGIDEKIVVSNIKAFDPNGSDSPRNLTIYKGSNENWTEWIKSDYAILGEDEGGVMGDPFQAISVKKGILWIEHAGGSNWKWSKIDKYRFQNGDLQLIGYTGAHGMPCNEWTDIDYNISTGGIEIKQDFDNCEGSNNKLVEEKFTHKIAKPISIRSRNKVNYSFTSPKHKIDINL